MGPETLFITGASAGFGEAIARRFAAPNRTLILVARRRERLEALKRELPGEIHLIAADVRDRAAMEQGIAALEGPSGPLARLDLVVNNAGLALGMNPAPTANPADWDTMIATNCSAVVWLTRRLLPGLVARAAALKAADKPSYCHLLSIGSTAGNYPYPGGNVYGATKAFVHQFALNLRSDLAGTGIRVTNVEPGLAETEFSVVRFAGDRDKAAAVYKGTQPLTADDIAETVWWVTHLPPRVNVNTIELMPLCQSFGAFAIERKQG
jgi:3-hydroxy acid dehydrogenase/malonic semialdehyde reductase